MQPDLEAAIAAVSAARFPIPTWWPVDAALNEFLDRAGAPPSE